MCGLCWHCCSMLIKCELPTKVVMPMKRILWILRQSFFDQNPVPIFEEYFWFFYFLALSANCVFWGVKQLLKDQQVEIIGMAFSSWFWTCFFWMSSWSIHEKSITLVEFEVRSGFRTTVFETRRTDGRRTSSSNWRRELLFSKGNCASAEVYVFLLVVGLSS